MFVTFGNIDYEGFGVVNETEHSYIIMLLFVLHKFLFSLNY